MQFSTLALAALASMVSAQKTQTTHVVSVAMNGTLKFMPENVKAAIGDFVQFQFLAGNHTVTQSTFDAPCQPVAMHSNLTGFHSGFQPAAASASKGMVPTYTIQINNTTPLWAYCAQAKHCESGMVMVINENTGANATRSLTNYKALAAKATTVVPGASTSGGSNRSNGTASSGSGSSTGTGSGTATGSGTGTGTGSGSGSGSSSPPTSGDVSLSAPSTFGLLALAGSLLFL